MYQSQQCSSSENVRRDAKQLRKGLQASSDETENRSTAAAEDLSPLFISPWPLSLVGSQLQACRARVTLPGCAIPSKCQLRVCWEKCRWELCALRLAERVRSQQEPCPAIA